MKASRQTIRTFNPYPTNDYFYYCESAEGIRQKVLAIYSGLEIQVGVN